MASHEELMDTIREYLNGSALTDDSDLRLMDKYVDMYKCHQKDQELYLSYEKLNEVPEPEKWYDKHGDALIKGGFAFAGVLAIVVGEKVYTMLFNSKAWNLLKL